MKHGKNYYKKRASDFGDNSKIRRKHGEASSTDRREWWEAQYQKEKRHKAYVKAKRTHKKRKPARKTGFVLDLDGMMRHI